jgi:hypothetical protein
MNIRFTEMTMNEVVSVVQSSGLLPQEDLLTIFTYLGLSVCLSVWVFIGLLCFSCPLISFFLPSSGASADNKPKVKFNTASREGAGNFSISPQ